MESCNFWEVVFVGFTIGFMSAIVSIGFYQIIIQDLKPRIKYHRLFRVFKKSKQ